jgi:endonuclease YncB( thermonuclease family)
VIRALRSGALRPLGRALAVLLLLLEAFHVQAGQIAGRVVTVADGDTIVVLDAVQVQHRIRLAAIDAPEWRQPFGRRSRASLAELVAGKTVRVVAGAVDRYGRTVGVVLRDGVDVNRLQIERGMAWWYRHYASEQAPADRLAYEHAENAARLAMRGLWSDPLPVSPWIWRTQHP